MIATAQLTRALGRSPFLGLLVAILTLALGAGCNRGSNNVFALLDEARRLAADLRIQFNKAADASNRAVMADTDEASVRFAGDAERLTQSVERDMAALMPLLRSAGFANEIPFLEQFQSRFTGYRKLDRNILTLAVENTNLKAQALSYGPARKSADAFRDLLARVRSSVDSKDQCRAELVIGNAVLAIRQIQVLQAPHIAESDDAAMTRLEQEMAALETTAREALRELAAIAKPSATSQLTEAVAALDRFADISRQLVGLSRRNSNVRSLQLALREKPPLTAACDDSLRALQDGLAQEGFAGTR